MNTIYPKQDIFLDLCRSLLLSLWLSTTGLIASSSESEFLLYNVNNGLFATVSDAIESVKLYCISTTPDELRRLMALRVAGPSWFDSSDSVTAVLFFLPLSSSSKSSSEPSSSSPSSSSSSLSTPTPSSSSSPQSLSTLSPFLLIPSLSMLLPSTFSLLSMPSPFSLLPSLSRPSVMPAPQPSLSTLSSWP